MANHGSLFLDEVANLDMTTQAKLLRALETHEYKPVGGNRLKKSDVRIIGATNRNLKTMVEKDEFREDFFYRLNVFPVFIPPLRREKMISRNCSITFCGHTATRLKNGLTAFQTMPSRI